MSAEKMSQRDLLKASQSLRETIASLRANTEKLLGLKKSTAPLSEQSEAVNLFRKNVVDIIDMRIKYRTIQIVMILESRWS